MAAEYVPLHVHTDASKDGFGTVEALVADAKAKGLKALAMTDHGTLANAISFWSLCREYDIKPILGLEGYVSYAGSNSSRNHLTLLAKNQEGWENLIHLSNHAHNAGWDGRFPVFTLEDLNHWRKGLHVLTGCHASPLHDSEYEHGMQFAGILTEIMGRKNLHAELMFISSWDDYTRALEAADRFNIPYAITNDTHFCGKGHNKNQMAVYRSRVPGIEGYDSTDCYLKTADELKAAGERWINSEIVDKGLQNTILIADEVEEWDMHSEPTLPKTEGALKFLKEKLKIAFTADVKANGGREERRARLEYEFNVFKEMELVDYVYILDDIIRYAKDNGILVGPGRGSGGGSYTLYLLGITKVDPIRYGLMFERFLSTARKDYPDVDVDFESVRRKEIITYAAEKYGAVPIATYSRYSHKSAVHDLARQFKVPKHLEIRAAESEYGGDEWTDFCDADDSRLANETYQLMLGQIRHQGRHPGGIVITDKPMPMERLKDEIAAAWTEGQGTRELSKAGIVKYDLLGLIALSQLQTMADRTEEKLSTNFDDKLVLDAFGRGEITGIFQWSGSDGIRRMTQDIWEAGDKNLTFNDLIAINALFRPGALDVGTAMKYKDFKKEPRKLHPNIDPILAETYGVICFQEQVMAVFNEVSGQGLEMANDLRKAFAHGKAGDRGRDEIIEKFRQAFMKGGKERDYDAITLEEVWREIQAHSRYSFNKAHSTAYSMIAYQMMWFRVYHFAEFIEAMMLHDSANTQAYLMEAVRRGMEVCPPHINISTKSIILDGGKLYLPLSDIAYFGDKGVDVVLTEREKGNFPTFEDFANRIPKRACNNRVRLNLYRIGAFKDIGGDFNDAISVKKTEDLFESGYDDWTYQREILGYIIPTPIIMKKIGKLLTDEQKEAEKMRGGDWRPFAGVVVETKEVITRRGKPMGVVTLSPSASYRVFRKDLIKNLPKLGRLIAGIEHRDGVISRWTVHELPRTI